MSSIYNCPHCGKKSFNPIRKAMAGQLNSKGKVCMECGRRCVNGKGATIFNAIYCLLAFAGIIAIYLNSPKTVGTEYEWVYFYELFINAGIIISILIVPRIVNAFFFKLSPAIRIEPVK
ncbi:MAG: hypothetical protein NC340_06695 [Ruminococcus flavefaciens]|nr:hypothetical protein [Ruminococcus flavefaciens]MCM1229772.1 hypothetical protein [Ruminococcus flavefaciens]